MEKRPDREFQKVLEGIQIHFSFLFQRGYQISSAMFTDAHNENWNVILSGDDSIINIHYHNEILHLALSSLQLYGKTGLFDLHELVRWMKQEDLPGHKHSPPDQTEQFLATAQLLEKHIDNILILFQKIHLGLAFSKARHRFTNNPPALLITQ